MPAIRNQFGLGTLSYYQGADGTESGGEGIIDFQLERIRPMGQYRTSSMID
jgi:hypothetical protein